METLETAAPVGAISKKFSDPNSFFKVPVVDLIKGFHYCLLSPGLFFLLYSLHCISHGSYSQIGCHCMEKTTFDIFYGQVADCC